MIDSCQEKKASPASYFFSGPCRGFIPRHPKGRNRYGDGWSLWYSRVGYRM